MNSVTSSAEERSIPFVIPASLPTPKFSFGQPVQIRSNYSQGTTGVVWGLEYINLKASKIMGLEYEGWLYAVHIDESSPHYHATPQLCCEENDLVEAIRA